MTQIQIKTEVEQDLTLIVFLGKVTGENVKSALESLYSSTITSNVLWDFSNCDVSALTSGDLFEFIDAAKKHAHLRPNGKSAFLCQEDLAFGLGRMYASLTEVNRHPIKNEIFRTREEALSWLNS